MGSRGTEIKPGEECPPGTTEIRPQRCLGPETPAPSILDYRPKSTLIAPAHPVPKAKFPAIDYHGHPAGLLNSAEGLASLATSLDSLNVRVMIAANNTSGEQLTRTLAAINASPMKDRIRVLTGIDLRNVGPGWAEKAVAQLEADAKAGAVGIGEIGKGFGLSTKKADGSRLKLDDPELKPVWDAAARLRLPVFIHTADPPQFFEPIDYTNERWLELSLFPERRFPPDRFPKFEELMTERDNLFRNNPKTTFVMAHMGWHANDLGRLGRMLDAMPNVYTEVGAVLYDIGRQPRAARDFFIKYQDRLLFGKDSFQPEEYPYYWRVFETRDDYFDYYRDYHAFWKLYGIDLPDAVLKKLYYQNALRLTPGVPQAGWPR
jgi:predicted TIM-barrel fold metal-dependent hydrolase